MRNILEWLLKTVGMRFRCSEDEKRIIEYEGNLIVMGRSGTGKTTCAILRLFVLQLLYHMQQKSKEGITLTDRRKGEDRSIKLHSMFVTASPFLAREIGDYYEQLRKDVKWRTSRKKDDPEWPS